MHRYKVSRSKKPVGFLSKHKKIAKKPKTDEYLEIEESEPEIEENDRISKAEEARKLEEENKKKEEVKEEEEKRQEEEARVKKEQENKKKEEAKEEEQIKQREKFEKALMEAEQKKQEEIRLQKEEEARVEKEKKDAIERRTAHEKKTIAITKKESQDLVNNTGFFEKIIMYIISIFSFTYQDKLDRYKEAKIILSKGDKLTYAECSVFASLSQPKLPNSKDQANIQQPKTTTNAEQITNESSFATREHQRRSSQVGANDKTKY